MANHATPAADATAPGGVHDADVAVADGPDHASDDDDTDEGAPPSPHDLFSVDPHEPGHLMTMVRNRMLAIANVIHDSDGSDAGEQVGT